MIAPMGKRNDRRNRSSLYDPFDAMTFTNDKCFLCGCRLANQTTAEHVFPRWVQREYHLADKKITLLNRTSIPYRQLTVPCCRDCNGKYLSNVENTFKQHFQSGFPAFKSLDELVIYQWIAKIFYGLLFKELSLKLDRSHPSRGFIMDSESLKRLKTLHMFLQSVRTPIEFAGFRPWSIFVVQTLTYGDERDFDYYDEFLNLTFSIRMGEIGILACLQDNGAQQELFHDYYKRFEGLKLHPRQFDELYAKLLYKASLLNRVPKYMMVQPSGKRQGITVVSTSLQGYSRAPIYNDWNQRTYAKILAWVWGRYGIRFRDIFKKPDMVFSCLFNEDGALNVLDTNGNPIGARITEPA